MFSVISRALKIAFLAMVAVVIFEVVKHSIHRNHSNLESHLSSVLFFTISAFLVSVAMLRREERRSAGLLKDVERRRKLEQRLVLQTSALDAAANAIVITDRSGVIAWVNRAFTDLTGYEVHEALGQTPRFLKSDKHDAAFYSSLWQPITSGAVWRGEITNQHKDGHLYVEEMTITPVRSEQGEITHFIAIKVDITQRKETEESLLQSESILRSMVQNAPYGIFRSTPEGKILSANPAICQMLGYSSEAELLRVNLTDVYCDPRSREPIVECLLTEGSLKEVEICWRRKDGTERVVRLGGHRLQSEGLCEFVFEGYVEDITEAKRAQSELLRLNRALSTLSKCNETLVHATDENQLLTDICETIVTVGGYRLAWVGYAEHGDSKEVRPVAKAGFDDGYIEKARITWADSERGHGPAGTSIRERRVVVLRDIAHDSEFCPWREEALRRGYGSVVSLPLSDADYVIGAITIYASEFDVFDIREVDLLKELADDLAYGIVSLRNSEKRRRAELALRSSEERYRTLYDHNLAAVFHSSDGKLMDCNEAMCRMFGYTREEIDSLDIRALYSDPLAHEAGQKLLYESGQLTNYEVDLYRKDRTVIRVLANLNLLREEGDRPPVVTGVMLEVTDVRKLQEQLLQSQKLEAVGKLTGGIAHDFNNILMIINSYSELILEKLDRGSPLHGQVEQIRAAGDRAASLTRQLLAFSRKQIMMPVYLKLNVTLSSFRQMLKRLIGEDIVLDILADDNLWSVRADVSQIEQVLLNLVVNARDAMPTGGRLLVRAANIELGDSFVVEHPGSKAGQYVLLTVTDTGCGISSEIRARIFEPFFTTKDVGKGSGLGLSTVYGIVKQSGGYITLESELGKGTTFFVYLPHAPEPETAKTIELVVSGTATKTTILVVEDEEATREAISYYLEQNGFRIVSVSKAEEAIRLFKGGRSEFDVLLTDVVMPGMNGVELAKSFRSRYPTASVIFMSGYTDDVLIRSGLSHPQTTLLPKPFRLPDLIGKLRSVLKPELEPTQLSGTSVS